MDTNSIVCDATRRAAELDRRARRITRRANRFRRLAELLDVAERSNVQLGELRAMFGDRQFDRMTHEGARGDDVAFVRGIVRERRRLARIAARFPNYVEGDVAYPLALMWRS